MSENRLAHTSMMIETQLYLKSCERFLEALKNHRGVVVTDAAFKKISGNIIEQGFPQACALLDSFEISMNKPGKKRLLDLIQKIKGWGF